MYRLACFCAEAVHGSELMETLRQDPWTACRDLPNISFDLMDSVAAALGADPAQPSRHDCAVLCALDECCASDGHAFVPWDTLLRRTRALLQARPAGAPTSSIPPSITGNAPAPSTGAPGVTAEALPSAPGAGGAAARGAQWGAAPAPEVVEAALQRLREEEMVVVDTYRGSGGASMQSASANRGPGAEPSPGAEAGAEMRRSGASVTTEATASGTAPVPEGPGPKDRCYLRTLYEAEVRLQLGLLPWNLSFKGNRPVCASLPEGLAWGGAPGRVAGPVPEPWCLSFAELLEVLHV